MEGETTENSGLLVTRRELAVLVLAVAVVLGAVLLLVLTSNEVAAALFGSG